ncbi:phosphoglycerate dehydrogenase [candidate division NPL-UPA2 bacterium]|nr:phosphoglycerate dehydrogenase [candidate division NPL-UPA2 bacterium]
MKVLVSDPLSEEGLEILKKEEDIEVEVATKLAPEELKAKIKDADALIVRSGTKVTRDLIQAGNRLRVIGRAGVGVDNVDVEAATEKGVIVMNSPGANTISTAEHTVALLLSLSRNIPQAYLSLKQKKWERKKFMGVEVYGKVLGIIGLGRIGGEVAKRAQVLGMEVIAYDPFLSPERAKRLDVKLLGLKELLGQADYITVHTPLTDETEHLIGPKEFKLMKDGMKIINCARGGIVDEKALYEAMKSGKVAGGALDVYEEEPPFDSPLMELDNLVLTPHIGASTEEAQRKVAIEIAHQVVDALKGRTLRNAVNVSSIEPEIYEEIKPYLSLAEKLGCLEAQLLKGRIVRVGIKYSGEVIEYDLAPITLAILKGLLESVLGETVNYVNARLIAREREIEVIETKSERLEDFANLISLEVETPQARGSVSGTLFGRSDARIVRLNGYHLDAVPVGYMLVCAHEDKPGIIGRIGTILGAQGINIAAMTLGRKEKGGREVTVLNLDSSVPKSTLKDIENIKEIFEVRLARL